VPSSFSWLHPSTDVLPPYRLHWSYVKWKVSAEGLQRSLPQLPGEGGGRQGRTSSWEIQALQLQGRSCRGGCARVSLIAQLWCPITEASQETYLRSS